MADGKWLDLWGQTLGNVPRLPGETDGAYNVRLMKEVQRSRLSINALELIVRQDLGLPIVVTNDAHDFVFVVGVSQVGGGPSSPNDKIIPDRPHSHDTINIGLPGYINATELAAIQNSIERNRAWGIMPIYQPGVTGTISASSATISGDICVIV